MNTSMNNLSQLNYRIIFARVPDLEVRAQRVVIPGLNLGSADQPTPLGIRIPHSGNITYDDLTVDFIISEDMTEYLEIFNWMVALGHPDTLNQFPSQFADQYSDMSVVITTSAQRPLFNVKFTNAFPINITPLSFDATLTATQYSVATVSFRFERFFYIPVVQ